MKTNAIPNYGKKIIPASMTHIQQVTARLIDLEKRIDAIENKKPSGDKPKKKAVKKVVENKE